MNEEQHQDTTVTSPQHNLHVVPNAQLSPKPEEKKLSTRHRRFCEEFLVDYNATQAYVRVYKAKPDVARANASRLLADANIRAYLEQRVEELQETIKIKQERVLRELQHIGFSNIADYLRFNENGITLKDSEDLSREQLSAVAEASQMQTKHGTNVRFKLHDKIEALTKLGQHLQLFNEDKLKDLKIAVHVTNVK